jgi:dTDP-4-amino-4,6-dideoxygalactose transaminase
MRVPFVDLQAQYQRYRREIDTAISKVIGDMAFIRGTYVAEFETRFAQACGRRHCIGVGNGTDGLFITLKMLGLGPGDEVITVANSWIATSEAISATGAQPVFVDVEPGTFNMDPDRLQPALTPRTKAVLPVHLFGQPARMDRIADFCKGHDLLLVEDCAQAHFASFDNRLVGDFGSAGVFSFYPGKNLGAYGDAGAVVTDDDDLARRIRMFANHGAENKHQHEMEGCNSRLDGIQAAILAAKLPHINAWNRRRLEHAKRYNRLLADVPEVVTPSIAPKARHVFHVYCLRAQRRDALRAYLEERDIGTACHYPTPLPFLPAYSRLGYQREDFPVCARLQPELLSLPMFPELAEAQQDWVVDSIREFYRANRDVQDARRAVVASDDKTAPPSGSSATAKGLLYPPCGARADTD